MVNQIDLYGNAVQKVIIGNPVCTILPIKLCLPDNAPSEIFNLVYNRLYPEVLSSLVKQFLYLPDEVYSSKMKLIKTGPCGMTENVFFIQSHQPVKNIENKMVVIGHLPYSCVNGIDVNSEVMPLGFKGSDVFLIKQKTPLDEDLSDIVNTQLFNDEFKNKIEVSICSYNKIVKDPITAISISEAPKQLKLLENHYVIMVGVSYFNH